MIRVFLLDDHEVVRRGLTALLESAPDITVVGESGSAQEATQIIPPLRPDVAVLDARLPDGDGVTRRGAAYPGGDPGEQAARDLSAVRDGVIRAGNRSERSS
jgi:CheY-like chemotaxis protein